MTLAAPPPVFVLTVSEGPVDSGDFDAAWQADAQIPGVCCYVKNEFANAFVSNFSVVPQNLAYFPPGTPLHLTLAALPLPPPSSRTNNWRSIFLDLVGDGTTVELPVIWDPGLATDFIQAMANMKAWCLANGITVTGPNRQLRFGGFCPCQSKVNEGEFWFPSRQNNVVPYQDYTQNWLDVGYSPDVVATALAEIAAGWAATFPDVPAQFAFLNATQQVLGIKPNGHPNADGGANATLWMNAMQSAASAAGGTVVPVQQSYTPTIKNTNWEINAGIISGQMFLQLATGLSSADIIAALALAEALPTNVMEMQIHGGQGAVVQAFYSLTPPPPPPPPPSITPPKPDPTYDVLDTMDTGAPGVVRTREAEDALWNAYEANGFQPLTQAQIVAAVGPLPSPPAGLPRFSDSNPDPLDGWSIDRPTTVGSP